MRTAHASTLWALSPELAQQERRICVIRWSNHGSQKIGTPSNDGHGMGNGERALLRVDRNGSALIVLRIDMCVAAPLQRSRNGCTAGVDAWRTCPYNSANSWRLQVLGAVKRAGGLSLLDVVSSWSRLCRWLGVCNRQCTGMSVNIHRS